MKQNDIILFYKTEKCIDLYVRHMTAKICAGSYKYFAGGTDCNDQQKTEKCPGGGGGGTNITPPNDDEEDEHEDTSFKPKRITQLMQLVKAGIYNENPFDITYMGLSYKFLDFEIFDKWAKYVWGNNSLVKIGARIIDARWIGSLKFESDTSERIINMMKEHKEIWLTMFWHNEKNKEYSFVRFVWMSVIVMEKLKRNSLRARQGATEHCSMSLKSRILFQS